MKRNGIKVLQVGSVNPEEGIQARKEAFEAFSKIGTFKISATQVASVNPEEGVQARKEVFENLNI